LENSFRKSGSLEDVLDCKRALRDIRCVFKDPHVTRHESRRRKTEHLPERKIPRHHSEYNTDRLEGNPCSAVFHNDIFVCEKRLSAFGIVATGERALLSASAIPALMGFPISIVMRRPSSFFSASRISAARVINAARSANGNSRCSRKALAARVSV
jgi:hypothetical protein